MTKSYILADDCGFRHLRMIYKSLFTVETVESCSQQSEKRRFRLRVSLSLFHNEDTRSNAKA